MEPHENAIAAVVVVVVVCIIGWWSTNHPDEPGCTTEVVSITSDGTNALPLYDCVKEGRK